MSERITLEDELKKNEDFNREEFDLLSKWCTLQEHLPQIDDILLSLLFHSCEFSLELAKEATDNYFTIRTHASDLFASRDPLNVNVRNGNPVVNIFFLNKQTPQNYRVCFVKPNNTDPADFVFSECIKSFLMHQDLELYLNGSAPGDLFIIDMAGLTLGHLSRLNLVTARHLLQYIQEAMPVRLMKVHFINVVPFIDKIKALLQQYMRADFLEKLKFHPESMQTLFEFVPQKILPKDYGGRDKSIAELSSEQFQLIQNYKNWFEEEEKLRVNESKRIGKSKMEDEISVQDSFTRLHFD